MTEISPLSLSQGLLFLVALPCTLSLCRSLALSQQEKNNHLTAHP